MHYVVTIIILNLSVIHWMPGSYFHEDFIGTVIVGLALPLQEIQGLVIKYLTLIITFHSSAILSNTLNIRQVGM